MQPLLIAQLPAFYATQVEAGIEVGSLESARQTVAELTEAARRCELARPTPSPSPAPRPSGTATPRATPRPRRRRCPPAPTRPRRPGRAAEVSAATPMTVVPRKRRGTELALLVFALGIGLAAFAVVDLNVLGTVSPRFPVVAAVCGGLALAAHLAVRWRLPYADPVLLPCVVLLNGLGLTMIHRIDLINAPPLNGARQQLIWTVLGVALFVAVVMLLRDHRPLQGFTYTIGLAGVVLLLLPLVPGLGVEKFGARIWIAVGPYSFQPAEAAKVLLSIAFASYLVEKRDVLALAGWRVLGLDLPRARDLGPILVMWLVSLAVLVRQRDLGTSLLFFGLFVMMLYVATERAGWPVLGTLLFALGAYLGYQLFGHVRVRVGAWLDPFSDYDAYYQVINAQFGMAWGGLLGTGLGEGRPGLTPLARSDFIAAALGEELGMTGLMAIILVYGLVVARGLRTALQCREPFGKLLAAGLSFAFALQVFTIIGGVTRLLPLTGLTTPFMSQGGSSMISNWIVVALLLVVSHQARKPVVTVTPLDPDAETTQLVRAPAVSGGGPA
ncbi:cell division protein FtsW, lipid II flippase [Friedmanniella luteola]|uniref:Cell division protein FtsW, lipid II flippase n=2 Tax=Friedmanniella luteola TaxID=546871 RepID=A0A1H2ADW0_9ACTN|nr:FtsW/RodA/SpoVE family cell cycle protein [Friedmanniella luteola]SDT44120.1 cell division protein FtsW, lipid II flippase [Friedmanniella luteola]